jgi:Tol biopolymer transport system component
VMATGAGMILGTAAYMSPEQAKGHPADHRSDVFAFGSVLYEMLTGREAFRGETVADILASVLAREPDWTALPANINPRLTTLLKRCLDKSRKQRWQAIGDVRAELHAIAVEPVTMPASAGGTASTPIWKIALSITATAILAAAATAAYFITRPTPAAQVSRFSIPLIDHSFSGMNRRVLDVSPDGSSLVYIANLRFYQRPINALEARPIPMGDVFNGPEAVVFSPDGQSIAFWARSDRTVKRMSVSGGAAFTLSAPFAGEIPSSLAWHDKHLYFALNSEGIFRISEDGGPPETIVKRQPNEVLFNPRVLPGGQAILFSVTSRPGPAIDYGSAKVEVYSLKTQQRAVIIPAGVDASYVPTGHLVYGSSGVLYAVPFDVGTLTVAGRPVPVVEGVQRSGVGQSMNVAFSQNGHLVYLPGPAIAVGSSVEWQVALVDKAGTARGLKIPPANYSQPRFSSDGKRLAYVRVDDRTTRLWVHDVSDTTAPRPLTFEGISAFPVWFPNGERIAFQSSKDSTGAASISVVRADGSGVPERLTEEETDTRHLPYSFSADGQYLLFDVARGGKQFFLHIYSVREKKAMPFRDVVSTMPTDAQFAPDNRWVSYSQRINDRSTVVIVEPFPPTGAKYQVSSDSEDGHHAIWARTGTELFYNPGPGGTFQAVGFLTKPSVSFTVAQPFRRAFQGAAPSTARPYDVTRGPDGQPLFVGLVAPGAESGAFPSRIDVVLNWFEDLKAKLPK